MTARCLSVIGPPPDCGHKPTPERPLCDGCVEANERYHDGVVKAAVRAAENLLKYHGYTVTPPARRLFP